MAIGVMAFLSSGLPTLVFTIGLLCFPQFARVVYAVTNSMKRKEFVEASVALGAIAPRMLFRQILPWPCSSRSSPSTRWATGCRTG